MNKTIVEYIEYMNKIGDRLALYEVVATKYNIATALYPGSHIDVTPSLVIPNVTYIDNFKGAINFFKNKDIIEEYVENNKKYSSSCTIDFINKDYTSNLEIEQVDLIISQYAGFVGKFTKSFLKIGGILLCNDSHGDATLARFDNDFEFIAVINNKNKIIDKNLENYFTLSNNRRIDLNIVEEKMKGLKYKTTAENYLFRKLK